MGNKANKEKKKSRNNQYKELFPTIVDHTKINKLIYGYIHKWNKNNIHTQIPHDLIEHFIKYYPLKELKFDTNPSRIGWDIYFENNDKTVKLRKSQFTHKIALLNQIFTNKMCQQFDIKYIIRMTDASYSQLIINFGYLISDINNENINKLDCIYGFGVGSNDKISAGISIQGGNQSIIGTPWIDNTIKLQYSSLSKFKSGDIIKLFFDFKNDKWEMYHNYKLIGRIPLNGNKQIIPGVALIARYCWAELFECNLY